MRLLPWTTVLFLLAALPLAVAQDERPPNIVILLADDLGYGDLGCYGNEQYATPHLDALASEGMRFTDFHSSGPVCSPTRAGLVTGRYQQRAGIPGVINADPEKNRHHGLRTKEVTFAELLSQAGYATALFGKWHLGYRKEFNPTHHGFARFRGYVSGNIDYQSHHDRMAIPDWWEGLEQIEEDGYSTRLITKHAVEFIRENRERPFCLYIAHEAPHSPWQGPGDPPVRGPEAEKGNAVTGEEIGRAYREMVQELDDGVGRVIGALAELGLAERTLVIFLSDNGGTRQGSNGPLRGHKGGVFEGGHRVAAIARWPEKVPAGVTCGETAISIDLMPTMLELAGVVLPEGHELDGVSLTPVLLEGESLAMRELFWAYEKHRAMRDERWKLVAAKDDPSSAKLFDLDEDLGEQEDLSEKHPERVASMLEAIRCWERDVTEGATQQ